MSKISKEGYGQIQIIKNALDSIHDKLSGGKFYVENDSKKIKNIEDKFVKTNVFELVVPEFEAIAGIVNESGNWEEV